MQLDALLPAVPFMIPVVAVAFSLSITVAIQNRLYKPLVDRFKTEEPMTEPQRLRYLYYGRLRLRNAATAMEKEQCFLLKMRFLPELKIPYSSCKTITAKNSIVNHKWVTFTFQDESLKPLMVLILESEWAAFPALQKRVGELTQPKIGQNPLFSDEQVKSVLSMALRTALIIALLIGIFLARQYFGVIF